MDGDDQPPPAPPVPAADPQSPAAERLPVGVLCTGCEYELVGLERTGVCPECGLDIAANWSTWDLRRSHRATIEQLAAEFRALHWAAVFIAVGALVGAAGLLLDPYSHGRAWESVLDGAIGAGISNGVLLGGGCLILAARRTLRHANDARAHGAAIRRRLRAGVCTLVVGACFAVMLVAIARPWSVPITIGMAVVGFIAGAIGLAIAGGAARDYADQTTLRLGQTPARGVGAFASLPLAVATGAFVVTAVMGLTPWPWVAIPILVTVSIVAASVLVRFSRTLRALRHILAKPA